MKNSDLHIVHHLRWIKCYQEYEKKEHYSKFLIYTRHFWHQSYVCSNRLDKPNLFLMPFTKFNYPFLLLVKSSINLFFLIFLNLFRRAEKFSSDMVLHEIGVSSCSNINEKNIIYYCGSVRNLFNYKKLFYGINICFSDVVYGVKCALSISNMQINNFHLFTNNSELNIIKLSLFRVYFCLCMTLRSSLKRFNFIEHKCRASLLAPQVVISDYCLDMSIDTVVESHGLFFDPSTILQPASCYILHSECEYFYNNFFDYKSYERLSLLLENNVTIRKVGKEISLDRFVFDANSKVIVYSSAYDPGLLRANQSLIFEILRVLNNKNIFNACVKLHPAESKWFFRIYCFFSGLRYGQLLNSIPDSDFDYAVGPDSTILTKLRFRENILYRKFLYPDFDTRRFENLIFEKFYG